MKQQDLRKLQLIELEMLLEVDRICRENNIQYSLASGTLLGAVRHEGFIPWDDDLDVQMKRKEYEKFCRICKKKLNHEKYFLQTYETDKEYRWGYSKLRRKNTEYIRKGQEAIKCFSGVSIDIFIIDNMPDSTIGRFFYHYIRRICIKTLYSVVGVENEKNRFKKFIYGILSHVDKKIPLKIIELLAKISNKKNTEYSICLSFYRKDRFVNKSNYLVRAARNKWQEDTTELIFEGFPFYVVSGYMEFLKEKYRNIWEYPPEGQRTLHPPRSYNLDVEIDLRGRSVEEYMSKKPIYKNASDYEK